MNWSTHFQTPDYLERTRLMLIAPEMEELFGSEKAERYRALVQKKCEYYRARPEENAVWEWVGGSNLLVTGNT